MKKTTLLLCLLFITGILKSEEWIRVNQLGYLPDAIKVGVLMSEDDAAVTEFAIHDAYTGQPLKTFRTVKLSGEYGQMKTTARLNFSDFNAEGLFYLKAGKATSPHFRINTRVYDGTADFLLEYMRQQRCGYNPWLKDSCHLHDGYIVYHPTRSGEQIDVTGGWHDATDYLQYTATSANAVYQMMLAWQQNPEAFGDYYQANGDKGPNGIPDIVDEIKWGMDWLKKMNPEKELMFNQIADDRDHAGFREPNRDSVDYGWGKGTGRPVYFCTGEEQGLLKYTNRATGIASTAGKFASAFALGAEVLKGYYPEYASELIRKADDAFRHGVANPGACQTAPGKAAYFYEEDNWADDMELAAAQLYHVTGSAEYLAKAVEYGRMEPVTPWMGADSARHYQWYPFMNVGHFLLANVEQARVSREFQRNMRTGIERTYEKAVENPFLHGIPYIWCSNNLTTAMLTQCRLYRETTGDDKYAEMEASMRDWLFGCNPWGTSMIVGLPGWGDNPEYPHSSYLVLEMGTTPGGLVDGPVYGSIFNSLLGVTITEPDLYAKFQSDMVVYHDDVSDYSTNEPTMDGTACLTYYLSALQKDGLKQANRSMGKNTYVEGGIVKGNPDRKELSLVFTGGDYADGVSDILSTLKQQKVEGSFFLTGQFYEKYPREIKMIKEAGHYLGAHSYGHPLYCAWEKRDSTLITKQAFTADLMRNYEVMARFGIKAEEAPLFMPPFEWYNREVSEWAKGLGLQIVNFTPGTGSNADYTTPDMPNYRDSQDIYNRIIMYEAENGLEGNLMLIHVGTHPDRTDKFYHRLEALIKTLKGKGYSFVPLKQVIDY